MPSKGYPSPCSVGTSTVRASPPVMPAGSPPAAPRTHRALQSPAGAWWQGQGRGSPTGTAARRHRGRTRPTRRARLPLALPQAVPAPHHPQQPRDVTLAAEHDHDVCLAAVDLGEGEGGHVTPHLESSLEGVVYHSTVQVGGVIHHPAGKAAAQHRGVPGAVAGGALPRAHGRDMPRPHGGEQHRAARQGSWQQPWGRAQRLSWASGSRCCRLCRAKPQLAGSRGRALAPVSIPCVSVAPWPCGSHLPEQRLTGT